MSPKPERERAFREVLPDFHRACDAYAASEAGVKSTAPPYRWPAALRVPATFEFVNDQKGLLLRWRRIGDHSVNRNP